MTELDITLAAGRSYGIDEALVIYTSKIDVKDWVYQKAVYSDYFGKNWSYPPHGIVPSDMRNLMREYTKAILIIGKNGEMPLKEFRTAMIDIESKLNLNGFPKALALSMGPCDLCKQCTLQKGEPCVIPDKRRPSVEATGIDILGLVRKFKKNFETGGKKFASVGLILLE
ncbi:DUF2284 domain-containing protein [Candidatus Woesearchaeota archaeon]|nr:DUF2284 domain-containing protein [Candidatus Woesearchaeota archaeon]